jgi:hypothetical protein
MKQRSLQIIIIIIIIHSLKRQNFHGSQPKGLVIRNYKIRAFKVLKMRHLGFAGNEFEKFLQSQEQSCWWSRWQA